MSTAEEHVHQTQDLSKQTTVTNNTGRGIAVEAQACTTCGHLWVSVA